MKSIVVALTFLTLFSGCARQSSSSPSASPALTANDCVTRGGVWHANTQVCETGTGPTRYR